jgi:hypothetical protein
MPSSSPPLISARMKRPISSPVAEPTCRGGGNGFEKRQWRLVRTAITFRHQRREIIRQRLVEGQAHAQWIKNMPLHIGGVGLTLDAFDNISGEISGERDAIIGIGRNIAFGKEALRQVFRKPAPQRLGFAIP